MCVYQAKFGFAYELLFIVKGSSNGGRACQHHDIDYKCVGYSENRVVPGLDRVAGRRSPSIVITPAPVILHFTNRTISNIVNIASPISEYVYAEHKLSSFFKPGNQDCI